MNNRRDFLFRDAPAAFVSAEALLTSVCGVRNKRLLAWLSETQANSERGVDIARFAQVVTSDPTRMNGASSGRVEEYQTKDLFLESVLAPAADGGYVVPTSQDGMASIGLVWYERRAINAVELQFTDSAQMPALDGVKVQVWVGRAISEHFSLDKISETLWQGHWVTLPGPIERQNEQWRVRVNLKTIPEAREAVHKVRWIFPPSTDKFSIRRLWAFTDDVWDTAGVRVELEHPASGQVGEIEVYNGESRDPITSTRVPWDLSAPLHLKLRYVKENPPPGSTCTLLWFRIPSGSYSVALDDVLRSGRVYVPQAGLSVANDSDPVSLSQYLKQIVGKKTILERVREMPDQTLAQAMEKAHHSIQDSGPMLLSLACDNSKIILEPDGTVLIESHGIVSDGLRAKFGADKDLKFATHLHGGWLPIPVRTGQDRGITYKQTSLVAPFGQDNPSSRPRLTWLSRRPLGVVEYCIENTSSRPVDVSLDLSMTSDWKYLEYGLEAKRLAWLAEERPRIPLQSVSGGAVVQRAGKVLAFLDTSAAFLLRTSIVGDVLRLEGTLSPNTQAKCWAYLPRWEMDLGECSQLKGVEDVVADVASYWEGILRAGTHIDLPDPLLMNIIRSSQVHCLISSRNEEDGERIEQWGASTTYRALNALYYAIPSMDFLGFHDFAQRALDYYVARCAPDGLLSDGYTLAGLGWNLEMIWDHYLLTRDIEWLRKVCPQVEQSGWWIIRQKEKTKKLDPQGNKLPEYGLTPPGLTADWSAYNYYFCLAAYFYDGLRSASNALGEIHYEDVGRLQEHVEDFHEEILRAYKWAQSRMPVNQLQNGTWVVPYPSQVPLPRNVASFFPGEDENRPALGCYDVELGAMNMVPLGVLDPNGGDIRCMLDHLEDFWFLSEGWYDYPAAASQKDWFNLGGFSKVQPNLCRVAEIYAALDEIKPFVRSYFNFITPQINKQNLTFWEDFTPDSGAWGSTEGSGYFLLLTRIMLLMERGEELWLAPLITDQWLNSGMEVAVRDAPTRFGTTSYRINSFTDRGYIEAEISPPTRSSPKAIVIRLRHPHGKRIRAVTVNGAQHTAFDAARDIIRLEPATGKVYVKALYD